MLSQALDGLGRSELREWYEMDFGHPCEGFGAAEVIKVLGFWQGVKSWKAWRHLTVPSEPKPEA